MANIQLCTYDHDEDVATHPLRGRRGGDRRAVASEALQLRRDLGAGHGNRSRVEVYEAVGHALRVENKDQRAAWVGAARLDHRHVDEVDGASVGHEASLRLAVEVLAVLV